MRSFFAFVLTVIAAAAIAIAVPVNWAHHNVADGDQFARLMEPLSSEPAVQQLMAREVTAQITRLATEQGGAAPPQTGDFVTAYTRSNLFPRDFAIATRKVHDWLFTAPTTEERLAGTTSDTQLDLAPMIGTVVADQKLPVTVPTEVTVNLPGASRQYVIKAGGLASLRDELSWLSWASIVVAAVVGLLAMFVARRSSVVLFWLAMAAVITGGAIWLFGNRASSMAVDQVDTTDNLARQVVSLMVGRAADSAQRWAMLELIIGGAVALIALIFVLLGVVGRSVRGRSRRADRGEAAW